MGGQAAAERFSVKVPTVMKRMMIAIALGALVVGPSAAAAAAPQASAAKQAPSPATPPATTTPAPAAPAAVPFPADARIGYVNMQYIVSESKLGKAGTDKLRQLSDSKNTELATKNRAIQQAQQEIQTNQSVWAPNVLAQKNADLAKMQNELQFLTQQRDTDMQTLNQQLLDEFGQKVLPIVEQVRAEKKLWMVFVTGDAIAAAQPGLDLSDEVIKRLDAVAPTATAGAPATPAPAPAGK
jgi:outer membrane protein